MEEHKATVENVKRHRSRESQERALCYRELESSLHPEFMDLLRDKGIVTLDMMNQGDQPIELLRIIHAYMHLPSDYDGADPNETLANDRRHAAVSALKSLKQRGMSLMELSDKLRQCLLEEYCRQSRRQ